MAVAETSDVTRMPFQYLNSNLPDMKISVKQNFLPVCLTFYIDFCGSNALMCATSNRERKGFKENNKHKLHTKKFNFEKPLGGQKLSFQLGWRIKRLVVVATKSTTEL